MSRSISAATRVFIVAAGALCLAAGAFAQATQTKETVPGGAATVKKSQLKGELVATGSNWLIAKNAAGDYRIYSVPKGGKFIVDGAPKSLHELKMGTMLTADVTVTETPLVKRTTTITEGKVFWASPTSVIVTHANGENKQYDVPSGFKFDVDGKQVEAMELKPGMKLKATRIIEEPVNVITRDVVVTGVAPK
jgi:hypothetical protein